MLCFYRPQTKFAKVMFLQASVCPHWGGHVWFYSGGMHGFIWGRGACMVLFGGCAWFYSGGMHGFIWGGMCGFMWGACMVLFGGHLWFYSGGMHGFIWGGMHGFIRGVCVVLFGGACVVFSVFLDTMRYGQ